MAHEAPQPAGADLMSESVRKKAYVAYGLVGIGLGSTQVAIASVPDWTQPIWLNASMAVYTFLGGAFGFVARSFVGR